MVMKLSVLPNSKSARYIILHNISLREECILEFIFLDMIILTFTSNRERASKQYSHELQICTHTHQRPTNVHKVITVLRFRYHCYGKLQYQKQTIDLQFRIDWWGECEHIYTELNVRWLHISKPLLMLIADTIYQHCACLHMHVQMPHGSLKLPLAPGLGMDPAVALSYILMSVCMCESAKCINALKSHIYLSDTCDPLSNTPHFLYAHRGSLK